jgi:hypothetical protein
MGGHVARIGVEKHVYRLLVEKFERNGYHGRFMHRWEDIKIDRNCYGRTCREFIVEYGQMAGFCEHGNETLGSTKVLIVSYRISHLKLFYFLSVLVRPQYAHESAGMVPPLSECRFLPDCTIHHSSVAL